MDGAKATSEVAEGDDYEAVAVRRLQLRPLPPARQVQQHLATAFGITLNSTREVRVSTKVTNLIEVNNQKQTFTAMVRFEASWIEEELTEIVQRLRSGRTVDSLAANKHLSSHDKLVIDGDEHQQALFAPRLRLRNMIQTDSEELWYTFYSTDGPPVVCLRWNVTGVFQEVMELGLFPLDVQDLTMWLESGWPTGDEKKGVILVKNQNRAYKSFCDTSNFVQVSEYELFDRIKCRISRTPRYLSATGKEYSQLLISLRIERKSGYWWWNVILPLFIVTSSSFASYGVKPEELSDRCSITVTSLLAMVAFKYIISSKLPDINYPTLIDYYVLLCFVIDFLVVLLQVLSALGIIEEPVYQYQVCRNVNNTTNFMSSDICGISVGSVISPGPLVRTVQISMHLVWFSALWMAIHVLIIVIYLVFCWNRRKFAAFWRVPQNLVWVGPLSFNSEAKDEVTNKVRSLLERSGRDQGESVDPHVGTVVDVVLWGGEEAAEYIKDYGGTVPEQGRFAGLLRRMSVRRLRHPSQEVEEPYPINQEDPHSFAVVHFLRDEGAENAERFSESFIREYREQNQGGPFLEGTKVELLNPAFLALRTRKTYVRNADRVAPEP